MFALECLSSRSTSTLLISASAVIFLYIVSLSIYRIYFSPIARFPGPRLAAVTTWYEFYYDVVLSGQYQYKIKQLHNQYGPIIRITPFELHIDDPEFYDELYVGPSVRKTDKYRKNIAGFGQANAAFDTIPFALHRVRRAALNAFFSKKSVAELSPFIQAKVDQLCERFKGFKSTGAPVNLVHAFSAFTVDVITDYAFSKTLNHLEEPDFDPGWHEAMMMVSWMYNLGTHFHWIPKLLFNMPERVVQVTSPKMTVFPRLTKVR